MTPTGLSSRDLFPLIVTRNVKKDYPYGALHPTARLFIGLRQTTNLTMAEIAETFVCEFRQLRSFEERIEKNREGWYTLRSGLPASFGVRAPIPVECKHCKQTITFVPCVACCTIQGEASRNDHEPELPSSTLGTDAMPGSALKIAVMATRAQLGLSIFSDLDRAGPDHKCETDEFADQHRDQIQANWYAPRIDDD